ncbi:MAG: hypothetical protein QG670_468 [Thermoproteota archaeon]|nr:hypothetical protein [Thermoproteota archaeon]
MKKQTRSSDDLLDAINFSDVKQASSLFLDKMSKKENALKIHNSLFPIVQRVLNPPFIAPHLPKMYSICRQLFPYLEQDEIPSLVRLEIEEYARREKLESLPRSGTTIPVEFSEIKTAIKSQDVNHTAELFTSAYVSLGKTEFAKQLLLLGSGYLSNSLGHSISCTAFILKEMMDRSDPWPALSALADYFCKGRFSETPDLRLEKLSSLKVEEVLLCAVSGSSIVDLHHTITLYAIEQVLHLLTPREYEYMLASWVEFVGDKRLELFSTDRKFDAPESYSQFDRVFSGFDAIETVNCLAALLSSDLKRHRMGRFIIKGLCEHYTGEYNPHFITGLGAVLWLIERYWDQPNVALTGLYQYIDFFYNNS